MCEIILFDSFRGIYGAENLGENCKNVEQFEFNFFKIFVYIFR